MCKTIFVSFILFVFLNNNIFAKIIDGIAAIVNNEIITISDLNLALKPIKEKLKYSNLPKEEKTKQFELAKEQVLDNLINNKLIELKAKEMNYSVTEKEVDNVIKNIIREQNITLEDLKQALIENNISYETYREKLRGEILRARVVNGYIKNEIKIPKEEIEKYIKKNFSSVEKAEYHIKQIFFKKDSPAIKEALQKLKTDTFETIARKYSEGPFKDKGGDLGYFKKGEMLPSIEKAVEKMKVGDVKLIKSRVGYHIVKLVDVKAHNASKEKLYKKAEAILKSQKLKEKISEWIKQLREKAVIIKKI